MAVTALILLGAAAGIGATELGQHLVAPASVPAPGPAAPSVGPSSAQPGFVTVEDPAAGFTLAFPASWARMRPADPQVRLLAASGPDSVLVRVTPPPTPIGAQGLPAAKELTDWLVGSNKSVRLLAGPHLLDVGGLPGYYYFYTFTNPTTGQTGAHSHFLLFNGSSMISLVFQSNSVEAFKAAAGTFDQITATVHTR